MGQHVCLRELHHFIEQVNKRNRAHFVKQEPAYEDLWAEEILTVETHEIEDDGSSQSSTPALAPERSTRTGSGFESAVLLANESPQPQTTTLHFIDKKK